MGIFRDWRIEEHEVLESTNTRALEIVRDAFSRPDPNVDHIAIIAKRQTAGRGQHGRTWESPLGGLYLTAILQNIPPDLRPILPLFAGVATCKAVERVVYDSAEIRWPNDIVLRGKKVAGILCESVAQGSAWAAVIGIGLNVTTPINSLPENMRSTTTSLHLNYPRYEDPDGFRSYVLYMLDYCSMIIQKYDISNILTQVRKRDYLLHKQIEFQLDNRTLTGTASGIGDNGELLININNQILPLTHATLLSIDGQPLRP